MILGLFVRSIGRLKSTAVAHLIGSFVFHILKTRRSMVERNLALTFPKKSRAEIRDIARKVYRNQAENIIEVLRLPMIRNAEDAASLVDVDGRQLLEKTVARHKGGVIVSAHFGNWELLGLCGGLLVAPQVVVIKPLKNPEVNNQINAWRTRFGNRMVYDAQAVREGLRTLRNGGLLSILGDQSDRNGAFFMEFLGRQASVFLGPAFLALKAGVPLFVSMCHRTEDGRYAVDIEEIDMSGLGSSRQDAEKLAVRYTKVIERYIYRYPEEWFWLHDRWKRSAEITPSAE